MLIKEIFPAASCRRSALVTLAPRPPLQLSGGRPAGQLCRDCQEDPSPAFCIKKLACQPFSAVTQQLEVSGDCTLDCRVRYWDTTRPDFRAAWRSRHKGCAVRSPTFAACAFFVTCPAAPASATTGPEWAAVSHMATCVSGAKKPR